MSDFVSNEEIVQAARKKLHQGAWDYLVGAAESETTMRRNRLACDRLGFRPRILVDVSKIDTSSTSLGHKLRIPVRLPPIGPPHAGTPRGAAPQRRARGRARAGAGGARGVAIGVDALVAQSGRALLVLIVGAVGLVLRRLSWRLARRRLI